ncbi:MAG TPA: amino acid ABC transporter substrate-binding protein [Clostridiaceae bacterium]|nr:amino acid ABC transporter substrate-binding protein [Clostridiaceae bacterium]
MKLFKRIIVATCSVALLAGLALSGCGDDKETAETTAAAEETTEAQAETEAVEDETQPEDDAATDTGADVSALLPDGVLKMGLDDSLPPMGFRDEKNEIVGFDVDLAREAAKHLGVELELVPIDWSMKQQELDAENVDCLWNGYSWTEERAAACALTRPYMENMQVLVTMAESNIQSLDDMAGKKLSLQEGSTAELALDEAAEFKDSLDEVVPFKENVTAFKDIEAGQTDGLLIDSIMADYYIAQQDNPEDYVIVGDPLAIEDYVIAFRKDDTELRDLIEATLVEMKEDGSLGAIATEWFGKDITVIGE